MNHGRSSSKDFGPCVVNYGALPFAHSSAGRDCPEHENPVLHHRRLGVEQAVIGVVVIQQPVVLFQSSDRAQKPGLPPARALAVHCGREARACSSEDEEQILHHANFPPHFVKLAGFQSVPPLLAHHHRRLQRAARDSGQTFQPQVLGQGIQKRELAVLLLFHYFPNRNHLVRRPAAFHQVAEYQPRALLAIAGKTVGAHSAPLFFSGRRRSLPRRLLVPASMDL
ncbi:hypothetical protein Mapa_004709 [Marchantia paleacea]|nr:hypothetical protein Mapa_004709 [Marchantia paleacea]